MTSFIHSFLSFPVKPQACVTLMSFAPLFNAQRVCVCVSLIGCDDHCVECRGPGQCHQCKPPYATLQGQCVLQCGRNHFMDATSQVCKRKMKSLFFVCLFTIYKLFKLNF